MAMSSDDLLTTAREASEAVVDRLRGDVADQIRSMQEDLVAKADQADTEIHDRLDQLTAVLNSVQERADAAADQLAAQQVLIDHPDDCLKLPADTAVIIGSSEATDFQRLDEWGTLTKLPALVCAVVKPPMARRWIETGVMGDYDYAMVGVGEAEKPHPVAGSLSDAVLRGIITGKVKAKMMMIKVDEARTLSQAIKQTAEAAGLPNQGRLTPVLVVDLLGRVRAGGKLLEHWDEPAVAVVCVVMPETSP
jgi:hypothetical protein